MVLDQLQIQILQGSTQASDAPKVEASPFLSVLLVPECIYLSTDTATSCLLDAIEKLVEALRIEEFLKLLVEDLELVLEVLVVVTMTDAVDEFLAGLQVTRLGASVKLVLESVLDVLLQVLGDVIPVGDVPDPCHRHSAHELISKTRQLGLEEPDNMAVRWQGSFRLSFAGAGLLKAKVAIFIIHVVYHQAVRVQGLVNAVGQSCMVVGSVVALVTASDLARVDEVQVC